VNFAATELAPAVKLHVVRNGIDLRACFSTNHARSNARAALGLDPQALVVGTVGRLNPAKNHARLVEAFAILRANHAGSRLVIVGGGALHETIRKQVIDAGLADAVLMTGDRSDVTALLPAFDVFALTSDTEGYSVALLEAGAAALPCVVSDVGGNAEIIQDGITGVVVRTPDSGAFAAAFETLAADSVLRRRLGQAARTWVEENGSVTAMVRAYDQFYGFALAGSRRRASAA
jgi:glycosyltransferase involved in cell wall biosynthesis